MNRGLRIGSGPRLGGLGAFGVKGGGAAPDTTPPTVTIASPGGSPTTALPIPITFTLSETSTDFAVGDVTVGNGTIANFAGSGTAYTAEITPSAPNGTVTIDVASDSFHDAANNGNTAADQLSIVSSAFTIADEFTTNRAAGAVNGTAAEPTGGTRTVADVETDKVSIASQALTFAAQATGAWGEEGIYYPSQARASGKMLFASVNFTTADNTLFGWSTAADVALSSLNHKNSYYLAGTNLNVSTGIAVGPSTFSTGAIYNLLIVLRSTGAFVFAKGGSTYTNWTLVWIDNTVSTTPLYPAFTTYQSVFTADSIRLPATTWVPVPLAYDLFNRGDGAMGSTITTGPDSQTVTARAWATVGTWAISTNAAVCSALSGGVGIATVDVGTQNVVVELVATRSAGTSGAVLRYTDTDNYIKAVHNGTNLQVIEVVGGTPNTLINTAATYGATKRAVISLRAGKVLAFYDDVGAYSADTAVITGNKHGLFTDDTGATFDSFTIWTKGTGGEYETTLNKYINP